MVTPAELFDLAAVPVLLRPLFDVRYPWEVLARLDAFFEELEDQRCGFIHPTAVVEGVLFLGEGAEIGPHAYLQGPNWIGSGAQVGHGAYLRGRVIMAPGSKVLHASEVKRSLLLPGARVPHFNYVGDSILGRNVNLGAGVKLANFNTFGNPVRIGAIDTGLRKFGAALGDSVSVGCNAVLSPGTIVGRDSVIYNGTMIRGVVPAHTVVKLRQQLEHASRQDAPG